MKVSLHRSIVSKLFALITLCVVITVAGNSWQNGAMFYGFLNHQIEDNTVQKAREASNTISAILESWAGQIAVAMHGIASQGNAQMAAAAQSFVNSNKEYVAFSLIQTTPEAPKGELLTFSFTTSKQDARFGGEDPEKVSAKLKEIMIKSISESVPDLGDNAVLLGNQSPILKLPILSMTMKFSVKGQNKTYWAVLANWHTRIVGSLPNNSAAKGIVIDQNGAVFSSPFPEQMLNRASMKSLPLVEEALQGNAPFGFRGYEDEKGVPWLGAFATIPQFKIAAIIETDGRSAYLATTRIIYRTSLWALLFILMAVLLGYIVASGITRNLRDVAFATIKIAGGDFGVKIAPKSKDEVGVLSLAVNHMAAQIEKLLQSKVEMARLEKELETAKMVQDTFFPVKNLEAYPLKIASKFQPASECGGDWWGYYVPEEGKHFIFVADATGHGVPAALVTAMVFSGSTLMAHLLKSGFASIQSLKDMLQEFNKILYEAGKGSLTMTFFAAQIDTKTGMMHYTNAGHNFPILIPEVESDSRFTPGTGDYVGSRIKQKQVAIRAPGTPLGVMEDSTYEEKTLQLKAGDKILFYTDGLFECTNPEGEQWGKKNFSNAVEELAGTDPEAMKDLLFNKAFSHFGNKAPDDDITVVAVELSKDWNQKENTTLKAS